MKEYIATLEYGGVLSAEIQISASNRKAARSEALKVAKANAGQISLQSNGGAFCAVWFSKPLAFRSEHVTSVREAP